MEKEEIKQFKSRDEWRNWLEKRSAEYLHIWVLISKKGSSTPGLYYDDAVEEALCFGWIDGKMKTRDAERFLLRFSDRKPKSIWSVSNRVRALRLIQEGKMTNRGMQKIEQAKQSGRWEHPVSVKEFTKDQTMPPDLKLALEQVPDAMKKFKDFSNSAQMMYIFWINDAKKPPTRMRRIQIVVDNSLKNLTPSDYSFQQKPKKKG